MIQRNIEGVTYHPLHPGFLGTGHYAAAVIDGSNFKRTDPFIMLMDDQLDLPGTEPAGGPHPHAGFEIYTFMLAGNDELFQEGSMEIMTAGKGVVHTEEITGETHARILQLWVTLPPEKRWTEPSHQKIDLANVPKIKNEDKEVRIYSGSAYGLTSPLKGNMPLLIADFNLNKNIEASIPIPASHNGFIFVVEGNVFVGNTEIKKGESAWLNKTNQNGESEITFKASDEGARFIFYVGEPQDAPIVNYGPFIGDTQEDIVRLYKEYRNGEMKHIKTFPSKQFVTKQERTTN